MSPRYNTRRGCARFCDHITLSSHALVSSYRVKLSLDMLADMSMSMHQLRMVVELLEAMPSIGHPKSQISCTGYADRLHTAMGEGAPAVNASTPHIL